MKLIEYYVDHGYCLRSGPFLDRAEAERFAVAIGSHAESAKCAVIVRRIIRGDDDDEQDQD